MTKVKNLILVFIIVLFTSCSTLITTLDITNDILNIIFPDDTVSIVCDDTNIGTEVFEYTCLKFSDGGFHWVKTASIIEELR